MPGHPNENGRRNGATHSARRHVCAFVDSPDEQYRALASFLHEGLERGEKAIAIVDRSRQPDCVHALEREGVAVRPSQARGQLEVRASDDVYLPGGSFHQESSLASIEEALRVNRDAGYPSTRIAGCLGLAALDRFALNDLVEYEARANELIGRYDASALCLYPSTAFPAAVNDGILHAHPMVMTAGRIRENPRFLQSQGMIAAQRKPDRLLAIVQERFAAALDDGDRGAALEAVVEQGIWRDVPIPRLYLEVIQPALYEVGRRQAHGRLTVAEARLAIEICGFVLSHLRSLLTSAPQSARLAVVASVEGEGHDLGARMVADFLEMAGFGVRFLGADVPTRALVEFVEATRPRLLALSATSSHSVPALQRAVTAVRRLSTLRLAVAAGGQVFTGAPGLARELHLDLHARDAGALLLDVERLLS